ncbi:MAG: DNA cytosine methyltransferase [Fimbriimonadaceae bacterium]
MRYLSLFSGALGLDLGLERAGWECVGFNEFDPVACKTIRSNRPSVRLFEGDIRELSAFQICTELGIRVGELDAVVGGPPCQAFSTAGKRRGLNDERGNVFLHFVDLALDLMPRVVLIENVRGLLSAPLEHRIHEERGIGFPALAESEKAGGALREILSRFAAAGYGVSFRLYDTSLYGVPQVRERMVLVAERGGRIMPHIHSHSGVVTVREALAGLGDHHDYVPVRSRALPYLHFVGPGENWRALEPEHAQAAMGNAYFSGGGRTGFMRRLSWDKPSPTLLTLPNMPATLLGHPEELRPLSVQEYKRLQTFPDDWIVCGKVTDQYRQVGNAVPVEFARRVGVHVGDWLAGKRMKQAVVATSRYRATDEVAWSAAVVGG